MRGRRIYIDASEVNALSVGLAQAPQRMKDAAKDAFASEADGLHSAMRRGAINHRYLPKFARELVKDKVTDLHYEVGFRRRNQGLLANIIVFGSVNNDPVYDFYGPLRHRTPYFLNHLGRVMEEAVFRDWPKGGAAA